MPRTLPLEICVDSPDGLAAAIAGGADRIELCSALALGGLTPGPGMIAAAADCGTPCHAMIRPRDGDFILRPGDLRAMLADIAAVRQAGLAGVVIGVANPDGSLDETALRSLITAADGLEVTLHRVFDLTPDPFAALETAIALGIRRILTSGQAASAPEGLELLGLLVEKAAGRIEIMAGGGVSAELAPLLIAARVDALHSSCSGPDPQHRDSARIGIAPRRVTDLALARALEHQMKSGVPSA